MVGPVVRGTATSACENTDSVPCLSAGGKPVGFSQDGTLRRIFHGRLYLDASPAILASTPLPYRRMAAVTGARDSPAPDPPGWVTGSGTVPPRKTPGGEVDVQVGLSRRSSPGPERVTDRGGVHDGGCRARCRAPG